MGATWAEHGSQSGRDVEPRGANVELLWTYRAASCQLASWLQERRTPNEKVEIYNRNHVIQSISMLKSMPLSREIK